MVLEMRATPEVRPQVPPPIRSVLEEFLGAPIGPTSEHGYRKLCVVCMDWTGHIVLPTPAWQVQRCTRCGTSKVLKVIRAKHVRSQRSLMADPNLTAAAVFDYACRIFGVAFVFRALEVALRRDVEEREAEILRSRLEERKKHGPGTVPAPSQSPGL